MSLADAELVAFAHRLADEPDRWTDAIDHDSTQRTYVLLHEDADVNAWLCCWSEDQDTGFHDHDASAAAITVISGSVREDRLRLGGSPASQTLEAGETVTIPASAIHRVLHAGDGPAMTVHVYSPPLLRTGAYQVGDDGELLRVAQDGRAELRDAVVV